jgi:hypothetical protein
MAITPTKPIDPTVPAPPPRAQVCDIIKRYLKSDTTPNWRVECPLWYTKLWPAYPSVAFWTRHELSFPLNSLAWFLTEQGKAQLASDWLVFHYEPPAEPAPVVLDTTPQPVYPVPYTKARPSTIAAFLKT